MLYLWWEPRALAYIFAAMSPGSDLGTMPPASSAMLNSEGAWVRQIHAMKLRFVTSRCDAQEQRMRSERELGYTEPAGGEGSSCGVGREAGSGLGVGARSAQKQKYYLLVCG